MKITRFLGADNTATWGISVGSSVMDVRAVDNTLPDSVIGLIAQWDTIQDKLATAMKSASQVNPISRLAPVEQGGKIICIGLNYRDHAVESGMAIPEEPVVFCKLGNSMCGPDDPIILPHNSSKVDYEAELVIVMGKSIRHANLQQAKESIFGFTCGHDVSARDWQMHKPGGQWLLGKTFDNFAPIGPDIVTADEISAPESLAITMRINGETYQDSTTAQFIFSTAEVVAYLSTVMTLNPGDIIFTGTPPGVGFARKPPRYLLPGDVCEVTIEKIGTLTNVCIAESIT